MKNIIFLTIVLATLLTSLAFGKEVRNIEIIVPEGDVFIQNDYVRLKDIAKVKGGNSELVQNLENIFILKRLPSDISKPIVIKKNRLRASIRQARISDLKLKINALDKIVVKRKYEVLKKEKVMRLIKNFLFNDVMLDKDYSVVSDLNFVEFAIPADDINIELTPNRFRNLKGRTTFPFTVKKRGKNYKKFQASVFIDLLTDVVVAGRSLGKGHILSEEDLQLRKVSLNHRTKKRFRSIEELIGKVLKKDLMTYEAIKKNDVKENYLVKKGKKVIILAESSQLRITTQGVAKESGKMGDFIKVKNIQSDKMVTGEVLDEKTVRVSF